MKKPTLNKILIIQTASIGDVVLATPVIEKLRFFYPAAHIDFLVKKGIEGILKNSPHLRQVLVWDKSGKKYVNLRELILKIRSEKYDCVVNLQRFAASGIITTFSGAGMKLGFNKNPFSLFFTKSVKHVITAEKARSNHEVERNLTVIDCITDSNHQFPVKLYPSQADFAKVSQYKTSQYICLAPASLWFTKQYPAEKWIEFLVSLDKALYVYFLGSPGDVGLCNEMISGSNHPNSLNLAGKLSFLESAALMKDAVMNYVNDSAPLHFASAMNAPVTAIFCSTTPNFGFGPLSENSVVVEAEVDLPCKPCGLHGFRKCPEKHFKCALNIKKEQLLERLQQKVY